MSSIFDKTSIFVRELRSRRAKINMLLVYMLHAAGKVKTCFYLYHSSVTIEILIHFDTIINKSYRTQLGAK